MNYPQLSQHPMGIRDLPSASEPYRGQAQGTTQYPSHNSIPLPHPQQSQNYGHSYGGQTQATTAPVREGMHAQEMGLPITPGIHMSSGVHDSMPRSVVENGWKYELHVEQQPRRARMCGFGDKDRRPITPPPCVRLIITDISTGKEVDCNDVEHGMFVLNVDLWSANGEKEVNLVRHSSTSPSISCSTPVSYQALQAVDAAYSNILPTGVVKYEGSQAPYNPYPQSGPPQVTPYAGQASQYGGAQSQYQQPGYAPATNGGQYPPQNGYSQAVSQSSYYASGQQTHAAGDYSPQVQSQYGGHQYTVPRDQAIPRSTGGPVSNTTPQGMFTRNLIGSLAASAFRLTEPNDRIGIWFVLQDLSVRTEGTFRLRFSFVNVGLSAAANNSSSSTGTIPMTAVNTGKAPVLAACFSEVFTVYSAKRFPGVVESTALSKCFATQGIKIPIRKDGPGKGDKDKDDDYD